MVVKKYKSRLISINNLFEGLYTLEFKTINGTFKYYPGQFLHLAIDSNYDGTGQWPDSRCFSMQSNPNSETLRISYTVKGKFTRLMEQTLKIGSEVWLKLPYGDLFTQSHNKHAAVFISGGTGITPFLSLFNDSSFSEYFNPVLYAGFRSRTMNIYSYELEIAKEINPQFKFFLVYENDEGLLNIDWIRKENNIVSDYFISGPPLMIKSFREYLLNNGINSNKIFSDAWE
jgi:ferredoxin-NADP reductase